MIQRPQKIAAGENTGIRRVSVEELGEGFSSSASASPWGGGEAPNAPNRPRTLAARVLAWLEGHERDIVVDPIILGEIRFGILLLPVGKRRERLEGWFHEGVECIHSLPWDAATGLRWAELLARLRAAGLEMAVKDSMIAAPALLHGCAVVTRNRRDFEKAGVEVIDPFVGSV